MLKTLSESVNIAEAVIEEEFRTSKTCASKKKL